MSFQNALKKAEVKETKSTKKSNKPVVDLPELREEVDNLVEGKVMKKKGEAMIKKAESVILPKVAEIQDADAVNMNHSKSYEVVGNENTTTYVTQDRFTVSSDDEENIKEIVGDDFDEMFEYNESLTAKQEIFSNEELQNKVLEALGEELFAEVFEYKKVLKTKKGFDVKQYKHADKLDDLRIFVKQYKAALR